MSEKAGPGPERAPRFGDDAVFRVVGALGGPGHCRVELDLVDGGHDVCFGEQPVEVRRLEVGHADGARLSCGEQFLVGLPRGDVLVSTGQRPVDEQQVDVVEAEPRERAVEAFDGPVVSLVGSVEFGGDEEFFAGDAARPDPVADAGLVAVFGCRVDVPVAESRGFDDGPRNLDVVERPGAQTDLRDGGSVVEFDFGNGHPFRLAPPFAQMTPSDRWDGLPNRCAVIEIACSWRNGRSSTRPDGVTGCE